MSKAAKDAFQRIKLEIEKSVVKTVDENSDASSYVIAATLSQGGRPVAFFSRTLSASEQRHSAVEKEAAAIVESLRANRGTI